jgi:hypothetical protein
MRTLLAIAIFAGALAASVPDADAGRRSWRGAHTRYWAPPRRYYSYRHYYRPRARSVCREDARFFDSTGAFRGFPCWARNAFGQGRK